MSANAANLINGDTSDLCFNNRIPGSSNKPLPGIDLGTPKAVSNIVVWWWRTAYYANNFKIQGSNDTTAWTDVVVNLSASTLEQRIAVSGTFRYWRVFCVTGNEPTYCVISEMEAYEQPTGIEEWFNNSGNKISIRQQNQKVLLVNNTSKNIEVTLTHRV